MSENDEKRAALLKKLQDPEWMLRKQQQYDEIVGPGGRTPIVIDMRLPTYPELSEYIGGDLPPMDQPTTIDDLWIDRWQRYSGAFTLTRMPDETVLLDLPSGARYIYHVIPVTRSGHRWRIDEFDPSGKHSGSHDSSESHSTLEEALFEMHGQAHADFDDLTNEY